MKREDAKDILAKMLYLVMGMIIMTFPQTGLWSFSVGFVFFGVFHLFAAAQAESPEKSRYEIKRAVEMGLPVVAAGGRLLIMALGY